MHFSISLFIFLSITNNSSLQSLRFATISLCKPFFIIVGKPFEFLNNSFFYLREFRNAKKENLALIEENKNLKKQLEKNNFLYWKITDLEICLKLMKLIM